jgi:MFS family permease
MEAKITQILKSPKFLILYMIASCHLFQGYYIGNSFKQIGYNGGISDHALTLVGSLGAMFNGTMKIVLASLTDCLPFKPIFGCILTLIILSLITIRFVYDQTYLFAICVFINMMGDGSMTSMLPPVTIHVFGNLRGPEVYGFMFSVFGVAALTGTLLVLYVQSMIGYIGMINVCLCFTCLAAALTIFYDFVTPLDYVELLHRHKPKLDKKKDVTRPLLLDLAPGLKADSN